MVEKPQKTPIKLKSLREERENIRSNSNRPHILLSPVLEFPRNSPLPKAKPMNLTPVLQRIRKIDSPRSICESTSDSNLRLISKANAAIEALEVKEKTKQNGLLYKRDKGERTLKSSQGHKPYRMYDGNLSPGAEIKATNDRKVQELDFFDTTKAKKLSKLEAENLIYRLQAGAIYLKKP